MSGPSVPPLLMASINLYLALAYLVIYMRTRRSRVYFSFSALAFAVCLYDVCCALLYNASSPVQGRTWQLWQTAVITVAVMVGIVFVTDYAGRAFRWITGAIGLGYAVVLIGTLIGGTQALWSYRPAVKKAILSMGISATYNEVAAGPLAAVHELVSLGIFVYIAAAVRNLLQRGERERARRTVFAAAIFLLAAINDVAVGLGVYQSIYVAEYAFLALIVLMADALSSDLVKVVTMEDALRESERNYREVFDATGDAIFIHEAETGAILDVNRTVSELYGYTREEALRLNGAELSANRPPYVLEEARVHFQRAVTEGPRVFEWIGRRKDGSEFWVEVLLRGALIGGKKRVLAVVRDITERRQAEEHRRMLESQLQQAQKIEAVGRLAGGVAHDFNNLLQVILSHCEALAVRASDARAVGAGLFELKEHAMRGARLTRQLLLFSRREATRFQPVDLNFAVSEATGLVRRLLRENIEFEVTLHPEQLPVEGDRGQLEQVVINLVLNAADAMPDGGELSVETGRADDRNVWFAVRDTGHGIPGAIRDHIFEPFFTTKSPGEGSGLGLAVVHGIVSHHQGEIDVSTEEGRGTAFRVTLPRCSAPWEAPSSETPSIAPPVFGKGKRILVVEDESAAREALVEIASMLGFDAFPASGVEEARELMNGADFDVLLTDCVLTDGMGNVLAGELVAERPSLAVVVMSGYTQDVVVREQVANGSVRFLQKPFDMATLARELQAALRDHVPAMP